MGREGVFEGTNLDGSMKLGLDMKDNPLEVVAGEMRQRTHARNLNGLVNMGSSKLGASNELHAPVFKQVEVDADGSRGGLCLGWNNGCTIQLKSYSVSHIDVEIDEGDEMDKWRCIGFYNALDERIDKL
ncbi:reverse transcriptase [Gossypium australe]|uniref:Reverse transcriptase n=1 Tax=Gossypium australe TaxID=47621 RepID=A0A5B6VLD4_9ROSI|nr:reverse transcriptase [Gossypium australe]